MSVVSGRRRVVGVRGGRSYVTLAVPEQKENDGAVYVPVLADDQLAVVHEEGVRSEIHDAPLSLNRTLRVVNLRRGEERGRPTEASVERVVRTKQTGQLIDQQQPF